MEKTLSVRVSLLLLLLFFLASFGDKVSMEAIEKVLIKYVSTPLSLFLSSSLREERGFLSLRSDVYSTNLLLYKSICVRLSLNTGISVNLYEYRKGM